MDLPTGPAHEEPLPLGALGCGWQRGQSRLYSTISHSSLASARFGREEEEEASPPSGLNPGGVYGPQWAPLGTTQHPPIVCEGDKLMPQGTGNWRGGSPKPGTWWAVGTSQVGTLWTSTTPDWAPIRPPSPGKLGHWQPEPYPSGAGPPEDGGVGEGGWEEAQGRSPGAS